MANHITPIALTMGSSSDWETLQHAAALLDEFGVGYEKHVLSAHRMPDDMFAFAEGAAARGLKAIIAGAGGAAHLPGMLAAKTVVPVLGVPVASKHLQGLDSLYSIVQMPKGIPVATFAIGPAGAANAALFAVAMLANEDPALRERLLAFRARQTAAARAMSQQLTCSATATGPSAPTPGGGVERASTAMLGVLGGGQLGRMFVHAAQVHGYRVAVLEPDAASPAGAAADLHLCRPYTDAPSLDALASQCVAVTTEFENVPAAALRALAARVPVSPPADAVEVCQHRAREKAAFVAAGVPCAPHALVDSAASARDAALAPLLPGLLKTASLGYDGKGQAPVGTLDEVAAAWRDLGGVPCVLERRLALRQEISVIVARGRDGQCVHLPVQQNLHRGGILAVTQVPAPDVPAATAQQAVALARHLAQTLHYVGVLCVEFFVLQDGSLVANEMAPRPHNSGHYSIDACDLSQFDLQVRTLAGLPLTAPRLHSPAVMLNLLGDLWFAPGAAEPRTPDWPAVLALPGVRLHLYGKAEPRRGRKMGHLTVTAADAASARQVAGQAAARLGLPAF